MEYSLLIRNNTDLDSSTEALEFYARAEKQFYRNNFSSCLKILDTLEIGFYGHSLQDEVHWMRARIWLAQSEFDKAREELKILVEEYGQDIWADNALAEWAKLERDHYYNDEEALRLYQTVLTDHPDSFFTEEARLQIRKLRGEDIL
jgi:outer membrane protein assembly factor BamD (BamD/ComL family)